MKKKIIALIIFLVAFISITYAGEDIITLKNWEGSCVGIADGAVHDYIIKNSIPADKIIVVSLDWGVSIENSSNITLKNSETGEQIKKHGGWYGGSRMSYFVTEKVNSNYTVTVIPDRKNPYTVCVSVVDKIGPFEKKDASGDNNDSINYYISNVPEIIDPAKYGCLAKDGYYLCRANINGNATIYWEHVNYYKNFIVGALLWNKGEKPLIVKINSGSAFSYTTAGNSMEKAMCDVWLPWYEYYKKAKNNVEAKIIKIPAYNPENPGESIVWLLTDNVPKVEGFVENTFNGLTNITVENEDGTLYLGDELICDTYVLDDESVKNYIEKNIDSMKLAGEETISSALRGSGNGAVLKTEVSPKNITKENRFCFLLGGFDMSNIQQGEKVKLTYIDSTGQKITPENSSTFGFCNVYEIKLDSISSDSIVKGRITNSKFLNPNAAWDKWSGLYIVGYADYGDKHVFKKLIYAGENFVFDENVPQNIPVTYYFVISGMSSLPLGVEFYAE